jgi:hypothetical protein
MAENDHVLLLRHGAEAWNAWREANPSLHPDLREANLNGTDLSGAMLRDADLEKAALSRANLTGANLSGADLGGAYLSGAALGEANLRGADLKGTTLSGTNIKGANLSLADFSGANLSNADLTNTDLSGATLNAANLRLSNESNAELRGVAGSFARCGDIISAFAVWIGVRQCAFQAAGSRPGFSRYPRGSLAGLPRNGPVARLGVDRLRPKPFPCCSGGVRTGSHLRRDFIDFFPHSRLQGQREQLVHPLLFFDRHLHDTWLW